MKNPFFTIISTNYNGEQFLEECLYSVQNQTFQDFEHIVINDCSPNKYYNKSCKEIIENFNYHNDPKYKFIDLETNGGVGAARNKGIDIANGKFLLFLDGDDNYQLNHLESIFEELKKTEDLWDTSIYTLKDGNPFKINSEGKVQILKKPMIEQAPNHRTVLTEIVYFSLTMPLMIIPKSVLGENRFTPKFQLGEEPDLFFKIVFDRRSKGLSEFKIFKLNVESVMYRKHENSITVKDSKTSNNLESKNYITIYEKLINSKFTSNLEKFISHISILRYSAKNNTISKFYKKALTFTSKILSNWYF